MTLVTLASSTSRPDHQWLTPGQAAVALAVTVRDVYRLIDTGALPAYRIDNQIKLLAHDVDELRHRRRR